MRKAHVDGNKSILAIAIDAFEIGDEHKYIAPCGMTLKLICMHRIVT